MHMPLSTNVRPRKMLVIEVQDRIPRVLEYELVLGNEKVKKKQRAYCPMVNAEETSDWTNNGSSI